MKVRVDIAGWTVAAIAAMATSGCVVSPQPLPPVVPQIDFARLEIVPLEGFVEIRGLPGAVTDGSNLIALAPTTSGQPAETMVAADGSFDVTLEIDPANIYRLEAELDGEFSTPIDISVPVSFDSAKATPDPAPVPFAGCLMVSSLPVADAGEVRVGTSQAFAVQLQNGCAADIVADDIHLRDANTGFILDTAAPLTIAAGSVRAVSLRFAPTATGAAEDLLVLHLTGMETGFVLVTTRGEGTP